jgi:diguanylate cyclase (GGDEF)-like protein/PAS domain S-box-containing protein
LAFTGRTLEQEQGNGWTEGVHPDDLLRCLDIYGAAFNRRETFAMEYRLRRHDGVYRWIIDEGTPRFDSGNFAGFVGHCFDISDRKRMEMELQSSQERLQLALSGGELGFWDWNIPSGEVLYSEHWFSMLGLPMGEAKLDLDSWIKLIHPDDLASVNAALESHLKGQAPAYESEHRVRHQDGRWLWLLDRGRVVEWDEAGAPVRAVGTYFDITERKRMENHIRELAFHDSLTQLPNRRLLRDRLTQAMAASKRGGFFGALMFLDLDNFKPLNDAHGHEAGDLLLIETADRLKACVREMDTVARVGGDEFVVLLSELVTDRDDSTVQARNLAEKIRMALSEPYQLIIKHLAMADTTVTHHCTASIGVALFMNHEASPDEVLKWADAGMYLAKESGRNSVWFYDPKA